MRAGVWAGLVAAAVIGVGCGGAPGGGGGEAGADALPFDAAAPGDAAGPDDAGPDDAADGSAADAPLPPQPADEPAGPCLDLPDDVYLAPPSLPPFTPARRGDVVRCARLPEGDYTAAAGEAVINGKGIWITATSGTHVYRVAYRTQRGGGEAALSTARVYLPETQRALPLPIVLVAHPTVGLADACAPSRSETWIQDLALPWALLGYAVIVPDFAGLGNAGVQGYLDNRDTAYSLLDGARALRKLLKPGALDARVIVAGHSQGGGAALSAQALAREYGLDGELKGVIAFAPEWPIRLNSFGYLDILNDPGGLTISTWISKSVVVVLRQYAWFANTYGADHAADAFRPDLRAGLQAAVESQCETLLGGWVQANQPHLGDLIDEPLRAALLACVAGDTGGCTEPARSYHQFLLANALEPDQFGAPVLLLQGLMDSVMPPAAEAACIADELVYAGVTPLVCTDVFALHTTIVAAKMELALAWAAAVLAGTTPPGCPDDLDLPVCTP
jgi:predicted esterase